MTQNRAFNLVVIFLAVVGIYLFATAPPPLQDIESTTKRIPIEFALEILNSENQVVRSIYTSEIVNEGKKRSLKFDENWQDEEVIAGPLPAQFLRETARNLERHRIQLGLYLGSDYAINKANLLEGNQLATFKLIKKDKKPRFFHVEDIDRFSYMFPDIAVAKPCIECHNKHPDSPKTDWKLDEVMGVTTWTYPRSHISIDEMIESINFFHLSVKAAYSNVINEISKMKNPPNIGNKWPKDGFHLPDADTFLQKVLEKTSRNTLLSIIDAQNRQPEKVEQKTGHTD